VLHACLKIKTRVHRCNSVFSAIVAETKENGGPSRPPVKGEAMATDYPESSVSSNPTLSAADHLQAAGVLLDLEASEVISGRTAQKLRGVADKLRSLAALVSVRRPA
jgi:hypothetical protein